MRHFFRTHVVPAAVMTNADSFFQTLGMPATATAARARTFAGPLGVVTLSARAEGGHYTFVEASTDQMGESRLDRNVKRFFVRLHKIDDPAHTPDAAY